MSRTIRPIAKTPKITATMVSVLIHLRRLLLRWSDIPARETDQYWSYALISEERYPEARYPEVEVPRSGVPHVSPLLRDVGIRRDSKALLSPRSPSRRTNPCP